MNSIKSDLLFSFYTLFFWTNNLSIRHCIIQYYAGVFNILRNKQHITKFHNLILFPKGQNATSPARSPVIQISQNLISQATTNISSSNMTQTTQNATNQVITITEPFSNVTQSTQNITSLVIEPQLLSQMSYKQQNARAEATTYISSLNITQPTQNATF